MVIEFRITWPANSEANATLSEVRRMVEDLEFCGLGACECADCVRHQVSAVIRYCQLASSEVSANILEIDKDEAINLFTAGAIESSDSLALRVGSAS
jgi:hypothetical protein